MADLPDVLIKDGEYDVAAGDPEREDVMNRPFKVCHKNSGIHKMSEKHAIAAGTSDAITATFDPAWGAGDIQDGQEVFVVAAYANATTTPTFAPNGIPAKTIVRGLNAALLVGDIPGAGYICHYKYRAAIDKWVLLNPATTISQKYQKFTTDGTFANPFAGVGGILLVRCYGGGGGGGGADGTLGGGGGSAGRSSGWMVINSAAATMTVTIGGGGSGGAGGYGGWAGSAGGSTSFGGLLVAAGGAGGGFGSSSTAGGLAGETSEHNYGAGGSGGSDAPNQHGGVGSIYGGGGGGGAHTVANGDGNGGAGGAGICEVLWIA